MSGVDGLGGTVYLPLVLLYRRAEAKALLDADLAQWSRVREVSASSSEELLVQLLSRFPEFRNLFYYRLRHDGGVPSSAVVAARRLWRPIATLDIGCDSIGAGLVVSHGNGTILAAKEIGRNCWVHHEVTVGWTYGGGQPTIGDDVFIGAGAKILGELSIGNGAKIGANAVVIRDVPDGATAVGVPARIIGSTTRS
jgi:serine O-acetyltransferase